MSYKTFVLSTLSIVLSIVAGLGAFIYYIDPLWLFGTSHKYNDVQVAFNERQQKMNHIYYQPFEYDTLLLGSSRSTYINQHEFEGMDVYNFAVSNISVREYNAFIEFAKEKRGKEFDRIIIGLDFFKTSVDQSNVPGNPDGYKAKLKDPFFRVKSILSWDALDYSIENFKLSYSNQDNLVRSYNRENVAVSRAEDPETIAEQTEEKIERFKEVFYGETYDYNEAYPQYLEELKKNNPNTEFIIFTTPISTPLFEAMAEMGRLPDYEKWLNDIVSVFGSVNNFMYPNSVTNDISNYFDGHHFYPEVGTLIAKQLSDAPVKEYGDFGMVVNERNLEGHLAAIERENAELWASEQQNVTN